VRNQTGVSLVEVLVAAVLLSVGIAGCLSALTGAARLRSAAAIRESLADLAESRLSWFEGRGCALVDTAITAPPGARMEEAWRVERDSSGVVIAGRARAQLPGRALVSGFQSRLACP